MDIHCDETNDDINSLDNEIYDLAMKDLDSKFKKLIPGLFILTTLFYKIALDGTINETYKSYHKQINNELKLPKVPEVLKEINRKKYEVIGLERELLKNEVLYDYFDINNSGLNNLEINKYLDWVSSKKNKIAYIDYLNVQIEKVRTNYSSEISDYNNQFDDIMIKRDNLASSLCENHKNKFTMNSWNAISIFLGLGGFLAAIREKNIRELKNRYDV